MSHSHEICISFHQSKRCQLFSTPRSQLNTQLRSFAPASLANEVLRNMPSLGCSSHLRKAERDWLVMRQLIFLPLCQISDWIIKSQHFYILPMDPEPQTTQETQEAQSPVPQHLAEPKVAEEAQGGDQQQQMQMQENQAEQPAEEPQAKEPSPEQYEHPLSEQKLLEIFKKYDKDSDGKINVEEIYQLLRSIGLDFYSSTIQWAAKQLHQIYEPYFIFQQFYQFYKNKRNTIKRSIMEIHMGYQKNIQKLKKDILKQQDPDDGDEIAPQVKKETIPEKQSNKKFEGDVELLVGDEDQNYKSFFKLRVTKSKKQDKKPYIKLILNQNSPENAKQFEEKLLTLYEFIVDLALSKEPDYAELIKEIKFDTAVEGDKLTIQLTTTNIEVLDFIQFASDIVDNFLDSKMEAQFQTNLQFNLNIREFLNKDSTCSLYDWFVKSCRAKFLWNALNMKQQTREVFRKLIMYLEQRQNRRNNYTYAYSSIKPEDNPIYFILYILMNMRKCHTRMQFNNVEFKGADKDRRGYVVKDLIKLQRTLQRWEASRLLEKAMRHFDNKMSFQIKLGVWEVEGSLDIEDLNLLMNQDMIKILQN